MKTTISELESTHVKLNLSQNNAGVKGISQLYVPKVKVRSFKSDKYIRRYFATFANKKCSEKITQNVFKQCSKTNEYYSIDEFFVERITPNTIKDKDFNWVYKLRSEQWDVSWVNSKVDVEKKREYIANIRFEHLMFLKAIMYGDINAEIIDMITQKPIHYSCESPFKDETDMIIDSFDLHHFVVISGVSVLKDESPSMLLNRPSLMTDINALKDLMGTILVATPTHKALHKRSSTNLDSFKTKYIPFVLQNKRNYNKIAKLYPIIKEIDFYEFKDSLR